MNDSILDKLRKLIRHERSARSIGSVAEADRFAEKIAELRRRYPEREVYEGVFEVDVALVLERWAACDDPACIPCSARRFGNRYF